MTLSSYPHSDGEWLIVRNRTDWNIYLICLFSGAFRNPPRHIGKKWAVELDSVYSWSFVAQLFHEVISQKFAHSFKHIVFAIIDDHNAMKAHNPLGNIRPFAEVFQVEAITVDSLPEKLSSATE